MRNTSVQELELINLVLLLLFDDRVGNVHNLQHEHGLVLYFQRGHLELNKLILLDQFENGIMELIGFHGHDI